MSGGRVIRGRLRRWGGVLTVLLGAFGGPDAGARPAWGDVLEQDAAWYGSAEAREIGRHVIAHQAPEGGWTKNTDMTRPPPAGWVPDVPTIDNGATTTQLRLLGRLITEGETDTAVRTAAERAIDYLLEAQYANGGWPQFFPLRNGYYSHITFNDDAMVRVLEVLQRVAAGETPFRWVGAAQRQRARAAVQRGIDCILRTQITVNGRLTAWCAQHDARTLAPAAARAFEPVALSGMETVGILRFLMAQPDPAPAVVRAVNAGVAWLDEVKLTGWRIARPVLPGGQRRDRVLEADPSAPPVWARFYELGTNRPIFVGRDRVVRYALAEVEEERRSGYAYYGTWGAELLAETYPAWRERLAAP